MFNFLCDYYYTFCPKGCPKDCPNRDTFCCPFFVAEHEDYYQYNIWEIL